MTNTLLGCDPKEVSPARAGAVFSEFAKRLSSEQGMDFTAAWNRAKLIHPDLHARMCEAATSEGALANGDGTSQTPALSFLLTNKPFIAGAFHLPVNVDNGILEAAWRGNGSQFVRVDSAKVFMAVQTCLMKTKGWNAEAARSQMCNDFPELCQFAKQMPDQAAGNTGSFGIK